MLCYARPFHSCIFLQYRVYSTAISHYLQFDTHYPSITCKHFHCITTAVYLRLAKSGLTECISPFRRRFGPNWADAAGPRNTRVTGRYTWWKAETDYCIELGGLNLVDRIMIIVLSLYDGGSWFSISKYFTGAKVRKYKMRTSKKIYENYICKPPGPYMRL